MKKLIILSLSVVAALGISMNASVKNNAGNADSDVRTEHRHIKKVAAHDPFAGIDLTETQKARLHEVFGGVRASQPDREQAQKLMAQIKKVLTAEQYVKYLENVAEGATARALFSIR